jgi:hypothetical protein
MELASLWNGLQKDTAKEGLRRVLDQVKTYHDERRSEERETFFHPVILSLDDDEQLLVPAFVRDISNSGIGLVHETPLEPGQITVNMQTTTGESVRVAVNILWCREMQKYWYISGGTFSHVVPDDDGDRVPGDDDHGVPGDDDHGVPGDDDWDVAVD